MEQKIFDLFKLNGQVALVIGGNRGLVWQWQKPLQKPERAICIAARSEGENGEAAANAFMQQYGVECMSTYCDVTSEESIKETVQNTVEHFGKIDILINSAGINIRGSIEDLSLEDLTKCSR